MRNCILFIFSLLLISCSSDNPQNYSNCINNAILDNEFMYKCKTYKTEFAQMNMDYTTEFETTSCILQFINSEHGDFRLYEGDENVTTVEIWLSIPSTSYDLQELPEGVYLHRPYNDDASTLDIVTLSNVAINTKIIKRNNTSALYYDKTILSSPENFQAAEVTVEKLPSGEYEIKYYFEADGKILKGHYKGVLSFADEWL